MREGAFNNFYVNNLAGEGCNFGSGLKIYDIVI